MRMRRLLLLAAVGAMLLAPSCAPSFDPPSLVNTLRILSVTADKSYAKPGEDVTLSMTVHDGLGNPEDPEAGPRALQILWLAGCYDPVGDIYFLCFEQLAEVLAPLAEGGTPPSDLVKIEPALPSSSGVVDAHSFTFTLPKDIVSRRPKPDEGPHYGIAYVFFAACAGTLAPATLEQLGSEVPEFPVQCLDAQGDPLGPDSFVPGYTQIYAFADERTNANPQIEALELNGDAITESLDDIPVVPRCAITAQERREASCGRDAPTDDCISYKINAEIGDVAETDPDGTGAEGESLRETIWVSYFADAGDLSPAISLVSDATKGYIAEHDTEWIPPSEPGIVTLWAVARDQRGGSSAIHHFVRVK